jgi:hypothetical protein
LSEVDRVIYTKEEYEAFVTFNKLIDDRFGNIRRSERQLTLSCYIGFTEELKPVLDSEMLSALKKMSSYGKIVKDMDVCSRLVECLGMIRKLFAKNTPPLSADNNTVDLHGDIEKETISLKHFGFEHGGKRRHCAWRPSIGRSHARGDDDH